MAKMGGSKKGDLKWPHASPTVIIFIAVRHITPLIVSKALPFAY